MTTPVLFVHGITEIGGAERELLRVLERLRHPPDIVDMDQQGALLCDDLAEGMDG